MTEPTAHSAAFDLARRLRGGDTVIAGWVGLPDRFLVEAVAATGLGAVVLDVQHGLHDVASLDAGIGAAARFAKPTLVRVGPDDRELTGRVLDMGAIGVIAPLVDTAAQAEALVAQVKYPPRGRRSWGPGRAMILTGITSATDHLATANDATLAFAMIETRAGLSAIDEILAVDGLDGVFIGPFDLSVALLDGRGIDNTAPQVDEALTLVLAACARAGKIPGIFGGTGARAGELVRRGFRLVTVGWDTAYVEAGINGMLAEMGRDGGTGL